jgi:CRISPR-associated endonuclease/helicase Cas3
VTQLLRDNRMRTRIAALRPVIAAIDPEAPPSTCAELAQEAALRFAELQAQWGSWGLAWWEALLRAADWAASRQLNERGDAM